MSIRGKGKRVYAMEQHGCTNIDERNKTISTSEINIYCYWLIGKTMLYQCLVVLRYNPEFTCKERNIWSM